MFCFVPGVWGDQIPWIWSYRWVWAMIMVLGIEAWSSAKAASAFNCWTISSALKSYLAHPLFETESHYVAQVACLCACMCMGNPTQVLMLVQQAPYGMSHLSNPLSLFQRWGNWVRDLTKDTQPGKRWRGITQAVQFLRPLFTARLACFCVQFVHLVSHTLNSRQ